MLEEIVVKLQGGLGNQLFQYAFAKRIQNETNASLILDISDFKYDKAGRTYSLEPFNIEKKFITIDSSGKYNWKYDQRKNWLIKTGVKFLPNVLFSLGSNFGCYIWEDIKYKDFIVDKRKKKILIHGLWQSEKYFSSIQEQIKKELKVISPLSDNDGKLIDDIHRSNSVCIHIRRGDFLKKDNHLYVCPEKYYIDAMDYIEKRITSPIFYVFSDDIDDVKKSFDFSNRNVKYIQERRCDYEEFRIMYNCKHFITSNSTFSWWASYLRDGDGIVIAPKKWYEDKTDISSLIRNDMQCL